MAPGELQQGVTRMPYAIANVRCENGPAANHVRIGWYRSVYNIPHAFAVCSFVDELAAAENGRLLLSKTAVSRLGERLWEDYQAFAQRDLSEYEITYLFVDGIAERLRPGAKREPVLAAWGFTIEGCRVLLQMMAGSKEDAETVTAFFEDMKKRGLNDPLLVTSDGAPGIVKAIEICFPRAARQRCLAHRIRNLAAKVPEDVWPDFKVRAQAAYQAPSRAIARELAAGVVAGVTYLPRSRPSVREGGVFAIGPRYCPSLFVRDKGMAGQAGNKREVGTELSQRPHQLLRSQGRSGGR